VREKQPISNFATVGIYLFSRGGDFVDAAIEMILRQDRVNGEYYTCPVYNYMIGRGMRIGLKEIPCSSMHGLGTPEDLNLYLNLKKFRVNKGKKGAHSK
jgi:dTDP-glucose pyrophosphorylase